MTSTRRPDLPGDADLTAALPPARGAVWAPPRGAQVVAEGPPPRRTARPPRRPGTETVLRRLRWQLTGVFAAVACAGLAILVATLVYVDTSAANRQLETELHGDAARAAALVFIDDNGRIDVSGVRDDEVTEGPHCVAVFGRDRPGGLPGLVTAPGPAAASGMVAGGHPTPSPVAGTPTPLPGTGVELLYASPGADHPALPELAGVASRALGDSAELGTYGWVTLRGQRARAAAMPWFDDDNQVAGAAVVVQAPVPASRSRVLLPAGLGGAGLLLVLTVTGWLLAGRSLRPAATALADRERFVATAAHELRTPLARLRAGAELVRRLNRPDRPTSQALTRLVSVADSADKVVSNLLLATRIDHADVPVLLEPVALDELAGELEHAYDTVVVDVYGPVTVAADAALLRHVMNNLVDNAMRHGRTGQDPPTVVVRVLRRDGCPVLQVCDDGPGFPDGDLVRPYVTGSVGRPGTPGTPTSPATGGAGLGLALVAWIAQRHGATMRLDSGPPGRQGAAVELQFPDPDVTAAAAVPASSGRARRRPNRHRRDR